ncbi:MoaD/ThiS family protein [Paenibacillus sp. CC-CFT747]|nr:MoaD/ThiS family protein [Paenibacillus sp. CC-CFT747]
MKLTIQLFAGLAERLGSPNLTVDIPDGPVTADGLKQLIARDYPESAQAVLQSFVARNQAYAPGDTALSEEDELALIPLYRAVNPTSLWPKPKSRSSLCIPARFP